MKQISRYHPLLVTLHWVLAVLIIAELPLGFFRTRGDTLIVLIVGTGFATAIIAGLVEIVFGHSGVPLPASLMIYPTSVAHVLFALLLVGFIILHVLGVLYHNSSKKTDRSAGCPSGNVCQIPRLRPKQPSPTL
jgi:cytochrome b561